MKFVLGLVALVLVGLLLYVYTGKENKQPQKQTVHKTVKEETPSHEVVASVEKKVSVKSKPVVQHTVKKESLKVANTSNSDGEIGEDLTLESIENADVSEEEKAVMRMDIAYKHNQNSEPSKPLSYEEMRNMIEQDVKNGITSSK